MYLFLLLLFIYLNKCIGIENMWQEIVKCQEPNQSHSPVPMLKLLPWRSSLQQIFPKKPFFCISPRLSQSLCKDAYDPPFSPASKLPKPKKSQTKKNEMNLKKDPNRPLKSDLPFDFKYSYSETNPSVEPIGYRESPKFSPFGPGKLDRKWTGTAAPAQQEVDLDRVAEERSRVVGDPLTEEEVVELVEQYRHSDCCRQINLGNLPKTLVFVPKRLKPYLFGYHPSLLSHVFWWGWLYV